MLVFYRKSSISTCYKAVLPKKKTELFVLLHPSDSVGTQKLTLAEHRQMNPIQQKHREISVKWIREDKKSQKALFLCDRFSLVICL